jgi:hypothetical protein
LVVAASFVLVLSGLLMSKMEVRPTLGRSRPTTGTRAGPAGTETQTETSREAALPATRSQRLLAAGLEAEGSAPIAEAPPRLIAEATSFDFGRMDPYTRGEHTFLVHNAGSGPLRLLDHRSTCSCTIGQFTRRPIPPGESAEVIVLWQTQANGGRFEQSAIVETNDPERPQLTFTITGNVLVHVGANPAELSLPSIRPDTRGSATTVVSSQVWSDFELRNIRSSLAGLTWKVEGASDEERDALQAVAAKRLTIELPEEMPQGYFTHWLRFELVPDAPDVAPLEYELPIRGKILRRLAVYGPGIDALGNVRLGVIDAEQGLKQRLMLKVYDRQSELPLREIVTEPDFLRVTIAPYGGEQRAMVQTQAATGKERSTPDVDGKARSPSTAGAHGLYYLDLEIPPGSPASAHQDLAAGRIEVRFDHPRINELKLRLHFAVAARLAEAN